ncbi:hypothetical protein LTR17_023135 [Elasticomyces elasticus]|nr:hypothetical protein LTR17_023135 [Elasticomyces elasticus]
MVLRLKLARPPDRRDMPREMVRLELARPPKQRKLPRETPTRLLSIHPELRDMPPSPLLALPPELREMIWGFVLGGSVVQIPSKKPGAYHILNETRLRVPGISEGRSEDILRALNDIGYPSILRVSKDVRREALPRYYVLSVFRFDDVDAVVVWLGERSVRMRVADYALTGTIAQVPFQDKKKYAYPYGKTQLRLLWDKDRIYHSNEDGLQAIKEQGHPAILRTSKQIRHEALPRYYIFSIFRFDHVDTMSDWLNARPTRVRQSIARAEFVLKHLSLADEYLSPVDEINRTRQWEEQNCAALATMLKARGVVLGEGILRARVNGSGDKVGYLLL